MRVADYFHLSGTKFTDIYMRQIYLHNTSHSHVCKHGQNSTQPCMCTSYTPMHVIDIINVEMKKNHPITFQLI